jgi:hypothetical protein
VKTRELDRMHAVHRESQAIGEFLDWLHSEKHVEFHIAHQHSDACGFIRHSGRGEICGMREDDTVPFTYNTEKLLAEFFSIDLSTIEQERKALLAKIRGEA